MKVVNNIKYLSQRDPRWAMDIMGSGSLTVGRYGCTTTCISMLSDYFGCKQDPGQIAQNKRNYSGDSNISWIGLDFPNFSFRWREGSLFSNVSLDMEMIKSYMVKGTLGNPDRAVILEVANHSHWVVGLWPLPGGDILAIDPWTGKTCNVLETYQNITGAALFVRWDKTKHGGKQAWQGQGKPQAPLYN